MQATQNNSIDQTAMSANEFLTFKLGSDECGIHIYAVQQICGYDDLHSDSGAPELVKGRYHINLNDKLIPVVNIRPSSNRQTFRYSRFTTVIILELSGFTIGIMVDAVTGIVSISPEQIKQLPNAAINFNTQQILGIGTVNTRMLILVDATKLLEETSEESNANMDLKNELIKPEIIQFLTCLRLQL